MNSVFASFSPNTSVLAVQEMFPDGTTCTLNLYQDAQGYLVVAAGDPNTQVNGQPSVSFPPAGMTQINLILLNNPHQVALNLNLPQVGLKVTEGSGGGSVQILKGSQFARIEHDVATTSSTFVVGA